MAQATPLGGVFALDWNNTETDDVQGLAPQWLRVGASWRWDGVPVRLDGRPGVIPLGIGREQSELHARARQIAERLSGTIRPLPRPDARRDAPPDGFVLTDGFHVYLARIVTIRRGQFVVFEGALPPYGQTCWITSVNLGAPDARPADDSVICFASDALISTPRGPVPIARLCAGDQVLTQDNGPQPVMWVGQSTLSGMALRHHPHLRPIRLRRGSLIDGLPEEDLCVSPAHRVLVRGVQARALFGCDEVLARAGDLVDYHTISPDTALHGVTYVHLLFEAHQIIFANGLPTESFHPALAPEATLRQHRHALRQLSDRLLHAPDSYGPTVRRCLNAGEAALLAA